MYIVKVLKRKDGAALVVGIVVGLILAALVSAITSELAAKITNAGQVAPVGDSWRAEYLLPTVWAALQLLAFEVLIRIYVAVHDSVS